MQRRLFGPDAQWHGSLGCHCGPLCRSLCAGQKESYVMGEVVSRVDDESNMAKPLAFVFVVSAIQKDLMESKRTKMEGKDPLMIIQPPTIGTAESMVTAREHAGVPVDAAQLSTLHGVVPAAVGGDRHAARSWSCRVQNHALGVQPRCSAPLARRCRQRVCVAHCRAHV
ncbi:hypothetical protein FGB62_204g00 [Gracilaria domingensis]|nr:hypothetical protein FGB62_204g00 [Gracilaria domingensis]